MKRTLLLVSLLIFIGIVACTPKLNTSTTSADPKSNEPSIARYSDADRTTLFNEASKGCYDYAYLESSQVSEYGGYPPGHYISGIKGLVLYCDFREAIQSLLTSKGIFCDAPTDFYELRSFECLSGGIPLFTTGEKTFSAFGISRNGKADFHHYNPEFVSWAVENLIPHPGTNIQGKTANNVFLRTYARYFKMMTETYVYLQQEGLSEASSNYKAQFGDASFDGLAYLKERFSGAVPAYAQAYDYTNMNSSMAIGFWLRRDIDGTIDEFWNGLTRVMLAYMPEWFKEHVDPKYYR